LLAGSENGFRWIALPGGLALFVVPILVHLVIPQSARWQLRHGRTQEAVDTVNQFIRRCGNRIAPLRVEELGTNLAEARAQLPKFSAIFAPGQFRWTAVGILTAMAAGTCYYLNAILLPKALIEQGAAVSTGFAITTVVFLSTIPGKAFNALLMERWGRRWTIAYSMAGALPGLVLMATAHLGGEYAGLMMIVGAILMGFTALSSFTVVRVYLSEQFPTALRGRGNVFGEAFGRIFAGVLAPFLMEPHVGNPLIFFGTITIVVMCGAFIPVLFGKETVGQLETVAGEPELVPQVA
jgi:putative MFS transporter